MSKASLTEPVQAWTFVCAVTNMPTMGFGDDRAMSHSDAKKLSVVLPFYNALQCLEFTVRSLQRQTLDSALWEIVVVDDGSGLPVGRLLESIGGDVATRLVTAKENVGRAAARNMGALNATGDVVLFHDADMFIAPDGVQRHYEFHQRSARSVLLGARYESSWLTLNRLRAGDTTPPVNQIEYDQRERIPHENLSKTRAPWLWVYGNNMSLPKSMLLDVGMFDESFRGWGMEDSELGYRLYVQAGRRPEIFTYDSDTFAFHIPHYADWSKNTETMWRNTGYFLEKHARFDVEIYSYSSEATTSLKVPIYEEMIAYFLARRLGNVTSSVLGLVPQDAPSLVIGSWLDGSPTSDKIICYDHSRPLSHGNKHQLGMSTRLADHAIEAVIDVDFWRFLLPYDLNKLVEESLRVAQRLILVQTHGADDLGGLMSSCTTIDYVAEMLGHHHSVTTSTIDGADVLRVTRR